MKITCKCCGQIVENQIDPYAHLKEAQERGETIQVHDSCNKWSDRSPGCSMFWDMEPDRYRIKPKQEVFLCPYCGKDLGCRSHFCTCSHKPKTKTLYKWAHNSNGQWLEYSGYFETEEDYRTYVWGDGKPSPPEFKRLDYTAIEVEA